MWIFFFFFFFFFFLCLSLFVFFFGWLTRFLVRTCALEQDKLKVWKRPVSRLMFFFEKIFFLKKKKKKKNHFAGSQGSDQFGASLGDHS